MSGNGDKAPPFLNFTVGVSSSLCRFYSLRKSYRYLLDWRLGGHSTGLNGVGNRNNMPLTGIELCRCIPYPVAVQTVQSQLLLA
jgi:hypothetical protein